MPILQFQTWAEKKEDIKGYCCAVHLSAYRLIHIGPQCTNEKLGGCCIMRPKRVPTFGWGCSESCTEICLHFHVDGCLCIQMCLYYCLPIVLINLRVDTKPTCLLKALYLSSVSAEEKHRMKTERESPFQTPWNHNKEVQASHKCISVAYNDWFRLPLELIPCRLVAPWPAIYYSYKYR